MVNLFKVILFLVPLKLFATNAVDETITDLLAWDNVELADTISDVTQFSLMASPFIYSLNNPERKKHLIINGIVTGVNYVATSITKVITQRIRPNQENNRSFWSGHTSSSFVGAALICRYSKTGCYIAIPSAFFTGYLRIAARKHWFSDVLIGAYIGYAGGYMTYNLVFRI